MVKMMINYDDTDYNTDDKNYEINNNKYINTNNYNYNRNKDINKDKDKCDEIIILMKIIIEIK